VTREGSTGLAAPPTGVIYSTQGLVRPSSALDGQLSPAELLRALNEERRANQELRVANAELQQQVMRLVAMVASTASAVTHAYAPHGMPIASQPLATQAVMVPQAGVASTMPGVPGMHAAGMHAPGIHAAGMHAAGMHAAGMHAAGMHAPSHLTGIMATHETVAAAAAAVLASAACAHGAPKTVLPPAQGTEAAQAADDAAAAAAEAARASGERSGGSALFRL